MKSVMMKLIIILFLTFSCTSKHTDNRIKEFENILGERKTKALNLLVSDFDKNLNRVYPNLETSQAYLQFLMDVKNHKITDWNKYKFQSKETNLEFKKSGLRGEIYREEYTELETNHAGKYSIELGKLKDSDSLINGYYEVREAAGLLTAELLASEILNSNPDFNNYFHKRIVVLEFSS